jgi:ATP-dependent DNA helicase RecG
LHREDLRWKLFREIVANLCVHSDYSSGYACFLHIFKDRVITKNPTRLLPEIPEGELKISQLQNYTKNPLLVRIFRELAWVEDMGSGMRNIVKFAPLYFPEYQVDINSSFQFVFSVTYNEMSETNVHNSEEMSITDPENVRDNSKMSEADEKMSETELLNVRDKKDVKKNKRQQAIVGLITKTPSITIDDLADILGVNEKTIRRDISELKSNGILERLGGDFGGKWIVKH